MPREQNQNEPVSVPAGLKQGEFGDTINVNGIEISWDTVGGTCKFRGIPVAMMWVDSTLAGLMAGVESMVGPERFSLALQAEGRKSVESDWLLIKAYEDFAEGFAQLNLNAKVAGWGDWQLVSHDMARRECVFRAYNNWEGGYQKALGVCWGSGMLAGKFSGIGSKLFKTNCWATQTRFVAKGDPYDEFIVAPSDRSLEQEIDNLLRTDNATRADMAVALTKLQDTERVLRESEQRYEQLVRNIPDGIYTFQFDPGGAMGFTYVSPRFCDLLGVDAWAILQDPGLAFNRAHPDDLGGLLLENDRARATLQPFRWEGRFVVRGETRWMRISSDPSPLPRGGSLWNGVISDITERKRAELELGASRQMLDSIIENMPNMVFMKRASDLRFELINRAGEALLGLRREQLLGRNDYDFFPKEQADFFIEKDRAALRQREVLDIPEEPVETPHGTRILHTKKVLLRDQEGKVSHLLGISEDITERVRADAKLRLAASVFANSYEGIIISNADNVIVDVNPGFTRITGYSKAEAVGRNPKFLASGQHGPELYAGMWQSLKNQGFWRGEVWNCRKTGEVYPEMLAVSVIFGAAGEVENYIGIFTDISQLKEHEAELDRIAHYDLLTGVPNRRLLADRLGQAIARAQRQDKPLAVCYLDLDAFKPVNDQYGHGAGDRLLVEITRRLQAVLRVDDTIARLGGDEFVLLLTGMDSPEECRIVLERVLATVSAPVLIESHLVCVSASVGVTLSPPDEPDADILLRHADQAMYRAKEAGKNRFHLFDPAQDRRIQSRRQQLLRLGEALEKGEFIFHFQPKVDLISREVLGVEALIRWRHPEKGLLFPGAFLFHIDGSDLEIPFGAWVLESVLRQMASWQAAGLQLVVSINISPNHLLHTDFAEGLRQALARYPTVSPSHLELEILETVALSDMARASATLSGCRRLGVRIALDDFGTGYSSLAYFRNLPVDILKIDQSFVRNMLDDPNDLGIVESVVRLAQAFNRPVIAEGVETPEHGALLMLIGCRQCQGFGIARPMPPEQLPAWIERWHGEAPWVTLDRRVGSREDVALSIAAQSHRNWVKHLADHLENPDAETMREIDPELCRFGRWYLGGGAARYGTLREFQDIGPVHERVHGLGRELLALAMDGKARQALERLPELYALRDRLLARLDRLIAKMADCCGG